MSNRSETTPDNAADTKEDGQIVVPAALSPADARGVHDAALTALTSPQAAQGLSIDVDSDEDRVSPCALQILIGTTRSAKQAGIDITLLPRAKAALEAIELN